MKLDTSGRNIARSRYQVYHFLTGDPGMCDYTDKVIKSLEPEKLKVMKDWNKKFTAPYTEDEFKNLIGLSKLIDVLWREQIKARRDLEAATVTVREIYGHEDTRFDRGQSIREKDKLLRNIYKSEHAKNAGAYARLKFAMDYWCSLWFWPISEANLLPERSEFISDMYLMLQGTMPTNSQEKQTSLFDINIEDDVMIQNVNLDQLCEMFPRLSLVRKIADDNKFMHWELEFADVFADKEALTLLSVIRRGLSSHGMSRTCFQTAIQCLQLKNSQLLKLPISELNHLKIRILMVCILENMNPLLVNRIFECSCKLC